MTISDTKRKQLDAVLASFRGSKVRLSERLKATPSTVTMALKGNRPGPRTLSILAAADQYAQDLIAGREVVIPRKPKKRKK